MWLLALFLLEDPVAPVLEAGEALAGLAQHAAVEPHRAFGEIIEKPAVVRYQHDGRTRARQLVFQPLDGRQVEMVGRLVEEQDVGLRRERSRDGGAARFAAGQAAGAAVRVEAQRCQQVVGAVRVVERPEFAARIVAERVETAEVGILRQVADRRVFLGDDAAVKRLALPGEDAQQRRLAGTVTADNARRGRRPEWKARRRRTTAFRRMSASGLRHGGAEVCAAMVCLEAERRYLRIPEQKCKSRARQDGGARL